VVPTPNVPPPPPLVGARTYRRIDGLAVALKWLLIVEIALSAVSGIASVHRHGLLDRVQRGDPPLVHEMQAADDSVAATAGLWGLVALGILVVLIVFLWRAAKNTELWQREKAKYGPGWTIGAWFIPIANLVLPAMVVQGIWKRSPSIDPYGYRHEESSARVGWWWITWIVSSIFVRLAGTWGSTRPTAQELSTGDSLRTVGVLCAIAAAVLLIGVVRRLAARQAVLARGGAAVAPTMPPPPVQASWPHQI